MANIIFEGEIPEIIKREIESVYSEILKYYENTGYSPPSGVNIKIGKYSCYYGRDKCGNAVIEMGKKDLEHYTPGTFTHENAHDVFRYVLSQKIEQSSLMLYSTLDEMFADLNAHYFGYPIRCRRDPFKENYKKAFEGLLNALSLDNRKREIELVRKILEEIEKNKERVLKYCEELYRIPPLQFSFTILEEDNKSNMFAYNIKQIRKISELKRNIKSKSELLLGDEEMKRICVYDAIEDMKPTIIAMNPKYTSSRAKKLKRILENDERYKKVLKGIEKIDEKLKKIDEQEQEIERSIGKKYGVDKIILVFGEELPEYKKYEEELKKNQEYQTLEKRSNRLLKAEQKLYERKDLIEMEVGEKNIDNILEDELIEECTELDRSLVNYSMLLDYLKNNGRLTDFILRSVESEDYGKNKAEFMDFPHEVGSSLAKKLYEEGVTPIDVINSPEKYLELCEKEIKETINEWLKRI